MSDFRLLERIQKETNIEKLRSMFIETVHNYESQMVGLNNTNESQIDILQQQLSDSNASISALNLQIKKLKEIHESELDASRQKEIELEKQLQDAKNETNALQEKINQSAINESENNSESEKKIQELMTENTIIKAKISALQTHSKGMRIGIENLKSRLLEIKESNVSLQKTIALFYKTTKKSNKVLKQVSMQALEALFLSSDKVNLLMDGLQNIREQVSELKQQMPPVPSFDTRSFKLSTEKKVAAYIEENQKEIIKAAKTRQRRFQAAMGVNLVEAKNQLTTLRATFYSTSSCFRLFLQGFKTNFAIMRKACMHSINTCNMRVEDAKAKEKKNTKNVTHQLKMAQTEIGLLQKERQVAREKRQKAKAQRQKRSLSVASRASSRLSSTLQEQSKPKETLVSVGTLVHISTPHFDTMKERSKRASKEAEVTVLEAEVKRKQDRITTLESQIAGLRRIVKRAGDTCEEENGKNRQLISELEEQLREEKKANVKKTQQITKMQKSLDDSQKIASKVEPLTLALNRIFRCCADRLAPLLAEQAISPDLSELDELSKQFFNVPIHKICAPQFSRAYLKKQEHRFTTAMQNGVEVDEMVKIFDAMMEEFVNNKPVKESKL